MPLRRDSRPSARRSTRRGAASSGATTRKGISVTRPKWLRLPSITPAGLAATGLALLGAVLGSSLLAAVWREPDPASVDTLDITPATLAEKPGRAITVLVIGLDTNRIGDALNRAAPSGPAAADAVMLVRVNPRGPLQVLNLPIELAVQLPGDRQPRSLGSLYSQGGVALTADVAREVVGLGPRQPDRYLVLSRSALRTIVDRIGGLELSPPQVMRYRDKAQNLRIELESGLQRLNGQQVEQLVRFRNKDLGDSGRRLDHQLVQSGLRERLGRSEQLAQLPNLLKDLQDQVDTNLTAKETLSLLAAGLDDRRPIAFTRLPLRPAREENKGLRQLDRPSGRRLWPAS
jgi:LCP family protein required for cell wall assembly